MGISQYIDAHFYVILHATDKTLLINTTHVTMHSRHSLCTPHVFCGHYVTRRRTGRVIPSIHL